ncbi:MAG: hypothetical protein RIE06_33825 [Roseibium album]|uniref:hypothetical protein n=1 Tax=Roseibium album TaxID=311410 RepID=UPI0032EF35E1
MFSTLAGMQTMDEEAPLLLPVQRSLFVDLSLRLAKRALVRCNIRAGEYQGWFWHDGVKSHGKTLMLLKRAGIFGAAKGAMLELIISEAEIPDQLRTYSDNIGWEELDLCIEAFVDLFSEFPDEEYPELPITRRAFELAEVYCTAFEKLKAAGYVFKTVEVWIWSDLMIPPMARIGVWSPDGVCYHDQP